MTKLEELLEETDFTAEEWEIYRKVEKHNRLEDLIYVAQSMDLTDEERAMVEDNADIIVERFDKTEENGDWYSIMENAIRWVIGE